MATTLDRVSLDSAHGKAPQQRRSQQTMRRIVEAAESLFAERGYEGASVNDIATRAGCSIGAFYARFTDKDSLFLHLHEHHCRLMVENAQVLTDEVDGDLAEIVRAVVDAQFRFADKRRAITRVFIQRSGQDTAFHARYAEAWGDTASMLRGLLRARRAEIRHPKPDQAVDFVIQMIHAGWANDVLHHGLGEITGAASGKKLRDELTAACLAYLGTE